MNFMNIRKNRCISIVFITAFSKHRYLFYFLMHCGLAPDYISWCIHKMLNGCLLGAYFFLFVLKIGKLVLWGEIHLFVVLL